LAKVILYLPYKTAIAISLAKKQIKLLSQYHLPKGKYNCDSNITCRKANKTAIAIPLAERQI